MKTYPLCFLKPPDSKRPPFRLESFSDLGYAVVNHGHDLIQGQIIGLLQRYGLLEGIAKRYPRCFRARSGYPRIAGSGSAGFAKLGPLLVEQTRLLPPARNRVCEETVGHSFELDPFHANALLGSLSGYRFRAVVEELLPSSKPHGRKVRPGVPNARTHDRVEQPIHLAAVKHRRWRIRRPNGTLGVCRRRPGGLKKKVMHLISACGGHGLDQFANRTEKRYPCRKG